MNGWATVNRWSKTPKRGHANITVRYHYFVNGVSVCRAKHKHAGPFDPNTGSYSEIDCKTCYRKALELDNKKHQSEAA